jgi:hypothetical protein
MPSVRVRRLVVEGVVVAAALTIAFVVLSPKADYGAGVTNGRIDSSTKFEFDYHADKSCAFEDVVYVFFDSNGNKLGSFANITLNAVVAGRNYHYIVSANQPSMTLDPRAVRFKANASCNGSN